MFPIGLDFQAIISTMNAQGEELLRLDKRLSNIENAYLDHLNHCKLHPVSPQNNELRVQNMA